MTLQELKQRAQRIDKHIVAAASDVAWSLSFEEIRQLPIASTRFTTKVRRYEENPSEETLNTLRLIVAGYIERA